MTRVRTRAEAFNEWMRQYTEDPARFRAEWKTVTEFLTEEKAQVEPSYGDHCDRILARLEVGESLFDD